MSDLLERMDGTIAKACDRPMVKHESCGVSWDVRRVGNNSCKQTAATFLRKIIVRAQNQGEREEGVRVV